MSAQLEDDYDLADVAKAMGMSVRWVREQVRLGAEHNRYGHKIRFTSVQVAALKASFATSRTPAAESITTGPKKSRTT